MVIKYSLKQLGRTPLKTLAFLVLLSLAVTFSMLGFQLWSGARDNIDRIDKAYMTIGTVEQKANSLKTEKKWDGFTKSYTYKAMADYDGIIPASSLDFEGADYMIKPEKRPCYGAYMPGFVMSTDPLMGDNYDLGLMIAELQPVEDCETSQPVRMKVKRVLCGNLKYYIDEVWFNGGYYESSAKLYANKTYIMSLMGDIMPFDEGYSYMPGPGVITTQLDINGEPITDPMTIPDDWGNAWDEVTKGFTIHRKAVYGEILLKASRGEKKRYRWFPPEAQSC